jgi:hemerythrin-like domain-containing protein
MTSTLPQVSHDHHERISRHVDQMPAVGDLIGVVPVAELAPRIDEVCAFLTDQLVPHMTASETALYPELERMLQNRHSMTPMRREHTEIRALIDDLDRRRTKLDRGQLTVGDAVALRRVLFRLYAYLKVHLAEEQLYLGIVEHGVSPEVGESLASALEQAGTAEI